MSKKTAKKDDLVIAVFATTVDQMTNIVLAFSDLGGFQAQAVGRQTAESRGVRLYLYSGAAQGGYVDARFELNTDDKVKLTLTPSEPRVSQHKAIADSLILYIVATLV